MTITAEILNLEVYGDFGPEKQIRARALGSLLSRKKKGGPTMVCSETTVPIGWDDCVFKHMTTIVGMVIIQSFCRSHIILFFFHHHHQFTTCLIASLLYTMLDTFLE